MKKLILKTRSLLFKKTSFTHNYIKDLELDDNVIKEEYKLLTKSGAVIFRYKSTDQLKEENSILINRIHELLTIKEQDYKLLIEPLIYYFLRVVSIAPASQSAHDSGSGGLVRHSLLVVIKLLELSFDDRYNFCNTDFSKYQCSLVLLGLLHDLSKIFTDYKISTVGQKYNFVLTYDNCILDDFCKKHNVDALRFEFIKDRKDSHDLYHKLALSILTKEAIPLLRFIHSSMSDEIFLNLANPKSSPKLYDLLKSSDSIACCISINKFCSLYEVGNYLMQLLNSSEINKELDGFYKLRYGYLVEIGTAAHREIIRAYDNYYDVTFKSKNLKSDDFMSDLNSLLYKTSSQATKENVENESDDNDTDGQNLTDIQMLNDALPNTVFEGPREAFFKRMESSCFSIRKGYKNGCSWNELVSNGRHTIVYGFLVELFDFKDNFDYSLVDEFKTRKIEEIFKSFNFRGDDPISSVVLQPGFCAQNLFDDLEHSIEYVDISSIKLNTFSKERLDLKTQKRGRNLKVVTSTLRKLKNGSEEIKASV